MHTFKTIILIFIFRSFDCFYNVLALSAPTPLAKKSLQVQLQQSYTPTAILENVGQYVNKDADPQGNISSLILVRLSKQLITLDNNGQDDLEKNLDIKKFNNVVQTVASCINYSQQSAEALVEVTKAACVISRLVPSIPFETWQPILRKFQHKEFDDVTASTLEPHQISGLHWALKTFEIVFEGQFSIPSPIQSAHDRSQFPFRIRPAFCKPLSELSVPNLIEQVNFKADNIRTKSSKVVKERRETAWEGDDHVAPFEYSGKAMERNPWSKVVLQTRDFLKTNSDQYYDGCLFNLYPDGGSAMRYHIDPDQGSLWDYETAVVSVGATRRFAFRKIPQNDGKPTERPHVFVLFHGDVTEMFGDCQVTFQHTVKTAEGKNETAPRASLVFKRTLKKANNMK